MRNPAILSLLVCSLTGCPKTVTHEHPDSEATPPEQPAAAKSKKSADEPAATASADATRQDAAPETRTTAQTQRFSSCDSACDHVHACVGWEQVVFCRKDCDDLGIPRQLDYARCVENMSCEQIQKEARSFGPIERCKRAVAPP